MNKLNIAISMANIAHNKQFDKGAIAYILHPLSVMFIAQKQYSHLCESMDELEEMLISAILHDVVEDSAITIHVIHKTFGSVVADVVAKLTKKNGQSYQNYINEIKTNKLAIIVKLADLEHNMDETRLKEITDKDLKRLAKYKSAFEELRSLI